MGHEQLRVALRLGDGPHGKTISETCFGLLTGRFYAISILVGLISFMSEFLASKSLKHQLASNLLRGGEHAYSRTFAVHGLFNLESPLNLSSYALKQILWLCNQCLTSAHASERLYG